MNQIWGSTWADIATRVWFLPRGLVVDQVWDQVGDQLWRQVSDHAQR